MATLPYTLTRDGEQVDLEVDFSVAEFHRQTRDDPAFGGEIEIEEVCQGSAPFQLTPEEDAKLEQWLADHFEPDEIEEDDDDGDDWN